MSERYELNEADIDSVIRWLKIYDPENATPEKAIAMIEEAVTSAHALSHKSPKRLEELLDELQQGKRLPKN